MKESLLGQVERSPVLSDWGDPDRSLLDLFRRAFGAARRLPAELIRRVAGRMGSLAATAGLAALLGSSLALGGEPVSPGTGKGAGDPVSGKPNIVFILADDLGYGDLGCYGQKEIQTPRLDRMSAEGVRFTQFYSSAPVCAPARRSLLSGLHGGHSTCRANLPQADMQLEEVTVAEVLKGAGYATAITGKWAEGVEKSSGAPNRQGFDHFFGIEQSRGHGYYHWFLRRNDAKVLYLDCAV